MIRDQIQQSITNAITAAQAAGLLPALELQPVEIQRPKVAEHGDYATNAALVLSAAIRKTGGNTNPRACAEAIAQHLPTDGPIGQVTIAGPGFINIRLADHWLQEQIAAAVQAGMGFGNSNRGQGQRWQVEYVSANPTGPVHYGGARNAALGDSLANVLEAAGYQVQREFYVNDAGTQFNLFAATLYARYAQLFGRDEPISADGYQGEYMIGYAQQIVDQFGDAFLHMEQARAIQELRDLGEAIVLDSLKRELASMNVRFDRWFLEKDLYTDGTVDTVMDLLRAQGDLAERDGAVWFLASKYQQNEKDVVVIRSTGAPTYFVSDFAYHYDKFMRRDFARVINVLSVDHQGHVPRMAIVMEALGLDPGRLTLLLYNLVKLVRDGQEVKLSKRKGNLLTISDVVAEVGADPVRFTLLTRSPESSIEFDLDLAVAQTNENPVYYVQYSHARICSILAKAEKIGFAASGEPAEVARYAALLEHPAELALMRKLLELEEQIDLAIDKLSPHNLTHYSMELAQVFNAFYRDCRVVDPEQHALSQGRLLLARAARLALAKSLKLLGVSAPESM